jgi:hypothetical protein
LQKGQLAPYVKLNTGFETGAGAGESVLVQPNNNKAGKPAAMAMDCFMAWLRCKLHW